MTRGFASTDRLATALARCLCAHAGGTPEAWHQTVDALLGELSAALGHRPVMDGRRGRKPVHDRQLAKAALLDFVTTDPDGMPHQAALVRELEHRLQASGHPIPGETWLKATVREFMEEAATFERDAAQTWHASPTLHAVFPSLRDFLAFRRSKARADQLWRQHSHLRSQYASPEKLLEAAFHKGFPAPQQEAISDHSRLPLLPAPESNCSNERSSP